MMFGVPERTDATMFAIFCSGQTLQPLTLSLLSPSASSDFRVLYKCCIIIRSHRMHIAIRCSLVLQMQYGGLSVGHVCEPCKNSWINRDALRGLTQVDPWNVLDKVMAVGSFGDYPSHWKALEYWCGIGKNGRTNGDAITGLTHVGKRNRIWNSTLDVILLDVCFGPSKPVALAFAQHLCKLTVTTTTHRMYVCLCVCVVYLWEFVCECLCLGDSLHHVHHSS